MKNDFTQQLESENIVLEPQQSTLDYLRAYSRVLYVQKLADNYYAKIILN